MKNVFYFVLLCGLFILTTAETCNDCDEVCLDNLEECAIELTSLQYENQVLSSDLSFTAAYAQGVLAGKLCPPPCRGPNPCDICAGCNIANCQFFVDLASAPNTTIEIYDDQQNLVATSGQPKQIGDSFAYFNINFNGNIPQDGTGQIIVTGPNGAESYPFDFDTN